MNDRTREEQINHLKNNGGPFYKKWDNQVFASDGFKRLGSNYEITCFTNFIEFKVMKLLRDIDDHWRYLITINECLNNSNRGIMRIYQGTNRLLICTKYLNYSALPKLACELYCDLRRIDNEMNMYFLSMRYEI